jgi:hypothetical protein
MANETRHTNSKAEDAKLVALYRDLKEGAAPPSAGLQKQFVFQLLDTKIARLDHATNRMKLLRNVLRIAGLAASGLATVVLGLKSEWLTPTLAQDFALIFTAGATFLGSIAALWEVDNYWLRNKIMLNKLKELRYRFAFVVTETSNPQKQDIKAIFDELIGAVGDDYWEKTMNRSMPASQGNGSEGRKEHGREVGDAAQETKLS